MPNLKLWNVVKKGLDAQIEAAKDPLTGRLTQEGVAISKLKNGVLRELDRLSPDYRAAREAWGGPTVSMAAMRQGQNIFKMEPEEIEDSFRKMTDNEREFFKLGAANTIRQMVEKTGEKGDEVRQLMLPYAKRQMRAMFPDDASFERFFASLNAEHKMWQAWASTYAGSNSADKLAEDMRADTTAASHGVRGLHAATEGRWLPAIGHGLQAVGRYLKPEDPRLSMAKAKLDRPRRLIPLPSSRLRPRACRPFASIPMRCPAWPPRQPPIRKAPREVKIQSGRKSRRSSRHILSAADGRSLSRQRAAGRRRRRQGWVCRPGAAV